MYTFGYSMPQNYTLWYIVYKDAVYGFLHVM